MDDEGKAESGLAVAKTDTQAEWPEPAEETIRADRQAGMDAEAPEKIEVTMLPAEFQPDAQTQQWAREGIPAAEPGRPTVVHRMSGRAPIPAPLIPASRVECSHCQGRGFMPGLNDYLRESAALLRAGGAELTDTVIRDFYIALFRDQPALIAIFPGDPTKGEFGSDGRGAKQRELLLAALAGLADLYDPGDPARMEALDAALKRFGRAHASFTRPDGTVRGATLDEYKAVKDALFTTLVKAAADKWRPEYTEAWTQAYDYAAAAMLIEQHRSGFAFPRFTRGGAVR